MSEDPRDAILLPASRGVTAHSLEELAAALEEIVWAANPSHDSLEGFSNYLSQYTGAVLRDAGLRCRLGPELTTVRYRTDRGEDKTVRWWSMTVRKDVGFVPDDEDTDTLLTAINSRLGALHVDPPRPWSTASRWTQESAEGLDQALRRIEALGTDVVLVGAYDHFELWSYAQWQANNTESQQNYADAFAALAVS